eukprot:COSAG03_NODE_1768_length_3548_cov_20.584807_2_plen_84_part_00
MVRQVRLRSELLDLQKVYELDKLTAAQRKALLAKLAALRDVDNRRLALRAAPPSSAGAASTQVSLCLSLSVSVVTLRHSPPIP